MRRKRLIAWLLSCAMLLTLFPFAGAAAYQDTKGHWAEGLIDKWSGYGVIEGYDGEFSPDDPIIRGDMAVIIDRLLDYQSKADNTFSDLGQAYYTDAVLRAAQAGVMQGYDGKVRPEEYITREEAVCMLARAMSVAGSSGSSGFTDDASISSWAKSNVVSFAQKGYVNGQPGNRFAPQDNVTRAEVVQILDNMISDYITKSGTVTKVGDGIVIVKASGVTLDGVDVKDNLVLGGLAGTVIAKNCDLSGKTVRIAQSTLKTEDTTGSGGSSGGSSSKVAAPDAYPLPKGEEDSKSLGVFDYDMTYYVTLTAEEGADIYYEIAEGKDAAPEPTTDSNKFETYQYKQIMIEQPTSDSSTAEEKNQTREKVYNVKAIAVRGTRTSEVANWNYTVTSNPRSELKISAPIDWNGEEVQNVTLIQDYDSDKMYLVEGSERAMVLDAGYFDADAAADLYGAMREIVGEDKPIDLVIGHPHPDHVQMAFQFLCDENKDLGAKVYVNERGIETLRGYIRDKGIAAGVFADEDEADAAYEAQLATLSDGDVYSLGDVSFDVIEMPGHQIAGIILFDKASGNLYTSDQMGNNRAHLTDSFWMQFGEGAADPMDVYLSTLQIALEKLDGKVKRILTGHNDVVLDGQGSYFANLEAAVQQVVDKGEDALTPTLRTLDSEPYLTNTRTSFVGDRLTDINWAGINLNLANFLSEAGYREDPSSIAELSNLSVRLPGVSGNLLWKDENFGVNLNWKYPDATQPVRKDADELTFTATVDSTVSQVEIVPTAASTNGTVTINGEKAVSGEAFTAKLTGNETTFTVVGTSPNGKATKTYTVKVVKADAGKVAAPYTYTDYDNYTDPFYPDTPGTFTVTQYVALFSDTPGATIQYTLDGSDPKTSDTAKEFDQTKYKASSGTGGVEVDALITIGADTGDDWDGSAKQTKVTLKAYASKAGMQDSDVVTFEYTIDRMSKNEHKSRLLYEEGDMKVWQVIDYDSDKMYLIKGADRALLIDAGMAPGTAESLYEYAKALAGTAEVDLYISHGHPDHTTQIGDFVKAGRKVYIHEEDIQMALGFINENVDADEGNNLTADIFTTIDEGYQFDLGGVTLDNYYVPGHTSGSMLLLDKAHNILYSSDAVGCNRRSVADSLTLASNDVRVLLSSVQVFKDKMLALDTADEIDLDKLVTWTGHDDYEIDDLIGHLDTVIEAAQNIVDYGPDAAMRKSVRDTGGSDGASIAGDRYANDGTGHFICMNGKKSTVLSGEDYTAVAELANLKVTAAGGTDNLMTGFSTTHAFAGTAVGDANVLAAEVPNGTQSVDVYPTAMATKATVTVGGETAARGGKVTVSLNNGYKEIPIVVTAPDGKTTASYTLTVRTYIDPMNPYKTLYPGEHVETVKLDNGETRTFTSYVPDGARESNAGIFVLPDQGKNSFDAWKTLADKTDTQAIDAEWTKQQEKFIVVYLDGLTYGESEEEREADIDYVNKVYAAASGRTMYCIHEAKNYMVGYGKGGTIAQMAAMDQTAVWAGLVTVGAGDVDSGWIEANGKEMASSLNGYNDQSNSTRKSEIQKSTLPLPVWIINDGTETDEETLQYWLDADKIGSDEYTIEDDTVTKYVRTKEWADNAGTGDYETKYGDNRDKEAYRVWVSGKPSGDLESTIWNDFLFGVRRWMADPGGDLRVTKDPIADLGMDRHYEEVGGWMREWYVYVPDSVSEGTPDVSVVFAIHGSTLNGGVYAGQTDWYKVADENNFIVVCPSAVSGSVQDGGNAPFPAWNMALDPTRADDIDFFKYMLVDLDATYDIDLGRVYATGHSLGSQMTYVLAINEPEMFAAVAPLSGFIVMDYIYDQANGAKEAVSAAGGVPVYMAGGTEGGTEWFICPFPITKDNRSGQTLSTWFALNGCDGSIDWNKLSGSNETIGSLDWQSGGAFTADGRWYTMTCEKGGVPMVQVEIVDYMPHATMPEHSDRVWDNWFAHFSRDDDGQLQYK